MKQPALFKPPKDKRKSLISLWPGKPYSSLQDAEILTINPAASHRKHWVWLEQIRRNTWQGTWDGCPYLKEKGFVEEPR